MALPGSISVAQTQAQPAQRPIVLHAAGLLDVKNGRIVKPGEVLVQGERIVAAGSAVKYPPGAEVFDLGNRILLPGLIDAHVHLFLHPGAEDLQTVEESVPQRTIQALLAARDDLMAGFTAERDMGTEGAGSADTAVRNAIDQGLVPGPRMRISGNAINILGGHEDAIKFNPAQHVLPNADYANNKDELIAVMREQYKEGADFTKIYETGAGHGEGWQVLDALSIHGNSVERGSGGGGTSWGARGGTCDGRAGNVVRSAGGSRVG